jgi:hypothetical protein
MRRNALGKQPARATLPWFGLSDQPLTAREPRQNGRPDGPLQVDDSIVLAGLHGYPQGIDFMDGLATEWGSAPGSGGGEMKAVYDRLR